jgi:hypothetical protein
VGQYEGFRSGTYAGAQDQLNLQVALDPPWDLRKIRPHFFPISASVVFGARSKTASPMPEAGERWVGKLQKTNATWSAVERFIQREASHTERGEAEVRSPYHPRFRQRRDHLSHACSSWCSRCQLVPWVRCENRISVRTARSANEKAPWKSIPSREAVVESEFVFRVHLGETVLPFRALEPMQAVLPIERKRNPRGREDRGVSRAERVGWIRANQVWEAHRSSARLTLIATARLSRKAPRVSFLWDLSA